MGRFGLLAILAFLLLAASPARAGEDLPLDDNKPSPERVRFYGEFGFMDFLKHEPEESPPPTAYERPRVQIALHDTKDWEQRTFPKFAIHVSGVEYYFGQNLGRNLIGRFFRGGYGPELTTYLHLDAGVDGFVTLGWAWHEGRRDLLSGVSTKLGGFSSTTVLLGVRPYATFETLFGSSTEFFRRSEFYVRFGVGGTYMDGVRRIAPLPEDWFWTASTLLTVHLTLGFEFQILGDFFLFVENGVRAFSPPNPNSRLRPDNETGPFAFTVWQAGFFFRFE